MVKLKRTYEFNSNNKYIPYLESKQDEERLKLYLGSDLFDQYMDVRKKLPNLSNQFKDFTKVSFDTGNRDKDIDTKKYLVNSYNRLIKYLPKDKQSLFKQRNINNFSRLGGKTLEALLDKYKEARDIVFKDQARFKDFGQLSKVPVSDIQSWVDSFSTNRSKRQQDKIEGANKLYEDSNWVVYRITTYPAAQLYGSNTKWCITGRYPGHEGRGEWYFNDYIKKSNLDGGYYFYISKKNPSEKYCVLQRKDKTIHSIWDSSDTLRGSSYDELGVDLPEIKEVNLPKYSDNGFVMSARKGDLSKVKEYIDKGFDINYTRDKAGNTPLCSAILNGHKDIVSYLLDIGAKPNVSDRFDTPLGYACNGNHKDIVELLLKHDANINKPNDLFNETPLLIASEKGYADIVELLLKEGAYPYIRDNMNHTPLDIALRKNYTKIADLLKKYGAKE